MNDKEKYPLLIGRSMIGNRRLHNTAEAADFICMSAEYGDTTITDVNGITVLTTYGMYIDKAVDTEYRDELLKALEPKQEELVGAENCLINGGEKEYAQNLDRRAEEYLKTEAYIYPSSTKDILSAGFFGDEASKVFALMKDNDAEAIVVIRD